MKHIVLGTAGHVDHGKTSLVKALTNIDTDRLKEEKERGITIELGFASLKLDDDTFAGIVDVPGHERFVKNMVAGAAGIDMVVLVIAADEGVMPQTREHLSICDLLNVRRGLVALTKIDLVDNDWRNLVLDDVRAFLAGSFLEGAPVVPISAHTGSGIPELVETLRKLVRDEQIISRPEFFRLPVDRIFTMKGFGTVVTGTQIAGTVNVGDAVTILPAGITTKVRGLQVHNEIRNSAEPGFRTAINFQGLSKEVIQRGDCIVHPHIFEPTRRLDIVLRHLPTAKRKLRHRAPVRFHIGTAEIMARLHLLDRENLEPGEEAYGQIILEDPTVAMAGDHFVIRSYSPVTTIGGGQVLDPLARKIKRFFLAGIEELQQLHRGDRLEKTEIILKRADLDGIPLKQLVTRTGIPLAEQQNLIENMFSHKQALLLDREDRRAIAWVNYENLMRNMLDLIREYHEQYPLKKGLAKEELRISLGTGTPAKLFNKALLDLEGRKLLTVDRETIALTGHNVQLSDDLGELRERILQRYQEAGLTPPATREILDQSGIEKKSGTNVLKVLVDQGLLIKLNDEMYFDQGALEQLRTDYKNCLLKKDLVSPTDFKELTGLSRKYIIPLMEYFDKTNLTIRVGNGRVLRESEKR